MTENEHPDLEGAAAEAERLADEIRARGGSLDPVYESLDEAIRNIEAEGYSAEDLLPADAEPGLGFSLKTKRDGKTLWQAVAYAGRDSLCDPESEVRKRISAGVAQAGAGSIVGGVLISLGLSPLAVPIAVAIAAVILAIGLKGFCDWISAPADEPSSA